MKYNHYSELPIGAFEPICGRMKLFGGGGNPIDSFSNVISDLGGSISNAVSDVGGTIGDLGNQIDQSVNQNVPMGWVLPAAIAAAVIAPELAPELFDSSLAAAPELDATGTLAEQGAALQGATVGGGLTDTGLSMIPPDTPPPVTDTGLSMIPPETPIPDYTPTYDYSPTTAVTNASPELDATNSLSQQALQAPVYDYSPNTPVQNVSPELDPTGSMVKPTSLSNVTDALRTANTAKNLLTSDKPTTTPTTTPTTQNNQALANMLKATQGQQTALPPIYKQGNPFFYSQQQQPIQDNLASLLRNNYGNS